MEEYGLGAYIQKKDGSREEFKVLHQEEDFGRALKDLDKAREGKDEPKQTGKMRFPPHDRLHI